MEVVLQILHNFTWFSNDALPGCHNRPGSVVGYLALVLFAAVVAAVEVVVAAAVAVVAAAAGNQQVFETAGIAHWPE